MTKAFVCFFLLLGPAVLRGFCPAPIPKVCSAYFESDAVFVGTVISQQTVPDKDDPGFTEGWLYELRVDRSFRGDAQQTVRVHTPNDSSRLVLEVGHQYLLFARSHSGQLQIGDDCGPLSDSSRIAATVGQIENLRRATGAFVEGEVRRKTASGVGVRGVSITLSRMGKKYRTRSDGRGLFRVLVPPGRYSIEVDPRTVALSDISWVDTKSIELVQGQCAQVQFVTR
jgi:hypothetical protein